MKTNEIEIARNGRVISKHSEGVVCTYDSRHRIVKVPMEDGSIFELFQERADSGTIRAEYRTELMTIMAPRGVPGEARVNDGGCFPERSGVKPEDVKKLLVGNILGGAPSAQTPRARSRSGGPNGLN